MFNIGFKEMAKYSLAGIIGIALPAILLAHLMGGYPILVLGITLFTFTSGFVCAGMYGLSIIKSLHERLNALNAAASVWIPKRGDKGRFVKASRDATYGGY